MSTLLIRLAAPLQSWGDSSRFTRRDTRREPTKSGVIGLAAAALGRRRKDDIADLVSLRFGVRIEQHGTLIRDFHTAHNEEFWDENASASSKQSFITERYYLADAVFVAGFEGDESLLKEIDTALHSPVFPLFLGRRACPPMEPLSLGLRAGGLIDALSQEPWQALGWYKKRHNQPQHLEIVYEASDGIMIRDNPITFNPENRRYGFRSVARLNCGITSSAAESRANIQTKHDPFETLGGDV